MTEFETKDFWKALILYGLNQATYKIALGKTLFKLCDQGYTDVPWDVLSKEFLQQYINRLTAGEAMPQQSIPARRTRMEQIVSAIKSDKLSVDGAISEVGETAFGDVIHRFHNLGRDESFQGMFYRFDFGKSLTLTDELQKLYKRVAMNWKTNSMRAGVSWKARFVYARAITSSLTICGSYISKAGMTERI